MDRRGVEPRSPDRDTGVLPFDEQPVVSVDLIGVEPITPILQGSVASIGMQAQLVKRSVRELNPVFRLTTAACCRNTYRPVVKSDPGWNRTSTFLDVGQASSPLDHGIMSVTRVGVEPTHPPWKGSTSPCCGPGTKKPDALRHRVAVDSMVDRPSVTSAKASRAAYSPIDNRQTALSLCVRG